MAEHNDTATDAPTPTHRRRIQSTRPLGAVACPACGENRSSGERVRFEYDHPGESGTESTVRCDRCLRRLREWYDARADDRGWVVTKYADDGGDEE